MQEAILFDCELLGSNAAYTIEVPVVLEENNPDLNRLYQAFKKALLRHDTFRVIIRNPNENDKRLHQVFNPLLSISSGIDYITDTREPIDPYGKNEITFQIKQENPGVTTFLLRFHHVLADRKSIELLIGDMFSYYTNSPLLPAGTYHNAVAEILNNFDGLQGDLKSVQQNSVSGLSASQSVDSSRHLAISVKREVAVLDSSCWNQLEKKGRDAGLSPQVIVLTAYYIMKLRVEGKKRTTIGIPFSLHDILDEPRTAGCFFNMVPFHTDYPSNLGFLDFAKLIQHQLMELLPQRFLPLLDVSRTSGQADESIFDAVFAWHDPFILKNGQISISLGMPDAYPSRLCHSLLAQPENGALMLALDYDPAQLLKETAEGMLSSVLHILQVVSSSPQVPVSSIPLGTQYLQEEENTASGDILKLIKERAILFPGSIAIIEPDGGSYSYSILEDTAEKIAEWASDASSELPDMIGLCIPRSFIMIAALIGLMRSRKTVALLDPENYNSTISNIKAGNINCVITDGTIELKDVITVTTNQILNGVYAKLNDTDIVEGSILFFSSGTTGRPKPVLLSKSNICLHTHWAISKFKLTSADRVLQFCSLAFDAMLEEVLPTFSVGATLILRDNYISASAAGFVEFCHQHKITVIDLPTGFFNLTAIELDAGQLVLPDCLRLVVIGGEGYTNAAVKIWLSLLEQAHPAAQLLTTYGPSEASIIVASVFLNSGMLQTHPLVGHARAGVRFYVLDKSLQPLPPGITGDLYIGGGMLAKGYLGRPKETAESFLPDPFVNEKGARMYFTGDRVIKQKDGSLLFNGRGDRQIKRRGVRIELDGIEHVFSHAFGGCPCAVIAYGASLEHIAVFIQDGGSENTEHLMANALAVLPYAAHPSLVRFQELPLTSRGKMDYESLRQSLTTSSVEEKSDNTGIEDKIINLFKDVLGYKEFCESDDFFNAGGHSLAVLQLISLANLRLNVKISVRDIYLARTIGAIAKLIKLAPSSVADQVNQQDDPWSLTELELAIHIDEQLTQGPSPYWITEKWNLQDGLDMIRLREALGVVLSAHPILRSTLITKNGHSRWADKSIPEALNHILEKEKENYLKLSLLSSESGFSTLLLNVHHSLLDGQGIDVFMQALANAYTNRTAIPAISQMIPPALPLSGEDELLAWKNYLSGAGSDFNLPPDIAGDRLATGAMVASFKPVININELLPLQEDKRPGNYTFFAALTMAWLHRMTNSADILLNIAVGLNDGIKGLRLSTCVAPLRSGINKRMTFNDLYSNIGDNLDWILDHLPIGPMQLATTLRAGGIVQQALPLLFDFEDKREKKVLVFDEIRAVNEPQQPATVRADIEISIRIEEDGMLCCSMRGRASMYSFSLLECWVNSLGTFLRAVTKGGDQLIKNIPLIPYGSVMAAMLEGEVIQTDASPDFLAKHLRKLLREKLLLPVIQGKDCKLTGQDVLNKAHDLINILKEANIKAGDCVIVLLPRYVNYLPVLLALWETGAIPVLINPEQPNERQKVMFKAVSAVAVIEKDDLGVIQVRSIRETNTQRRVDSIATAYIFFTSGSSGVPKPVICPWRGLQRLLDWSVKTFPFAAEDAFLHTASPGFDISIWEMLFPIWGGARLLVEDNNGVQDMPSLIRFIESERATHVHFIPSILESFLDALNPSEGRSVKLVFCGGEATSKPLLKRLLDEREVPMQHCYGPTETSIFILSWHGDRSSPLPYGLPLGNPVDGAGVVILDEMMEPVVRGITGEIGLYGDALTSGYLGMPRATAAAFRPWPGKGGRIYLTGDRGRMYADGSIEYIGRGDRQVKISGVRIELGEIEHVLSLVKGVVLALVMLRKLNENHSGLTAYIKYDHSTDAALLREELENAAKMGLPAAVIPKFYVLLKEFPLNINGKIDLQQLPEPVLDKADTIAGDHLITDEESCLKELWCLALGHSDISIEGNFFRLGGDSMTAIQITSKARKKGLIISLADFFRFPTIKNMAAEIRNRKNLSAVPVLISDNTLVISGNASQRFLQVCKSPETDGIQCKILSFRDRIDREKMLVIWNMILVRHDSLSLILKKDDDQWQLLTGKPVLIKSIPVAENLISARSIASKQIRTGEGIMSGIAFVERNANELVLAIHHLAVDFQSWTIIMSELQQAYAADMGMIRLAAPVPFSIWCLQNKLLAVNLELSSEPRRIVKQQLPPKVIDMIKHAGTERTTLLTAVTAQAIADCFAIAKVVIALENDGRNVSDGIDFSYTVGWLTGFKNLSISPGEMTFDGWLSASSAALKTPEVISDADYVINIIMEPEDTDKSVLIQEFSETETQPSHLVAIEFVIRTDAIEVTADCDHSLGENMASFLVSRMLNIWEHSVGHFKRWAPMTTFQESILSFCLKQPDSGFYHTQILFSLEGEINVPLLRKAWEHAAIVHDIFSCQVDLEKGDTPLFLISPGKSLFWREYTAKEQTVESLGEHIMEEDINQPFELLNGDNSRLYLVNGSDGTRLIWSHHHLFFDGWSLNLVIETVGRSYLALSDNGILPLPAPSVSSYLEWWSQRDNDKLLSRWYERLKENNSPKNFNLPKITEQKKYCSLSLSLTVSETAELENLSTQQQVTLFEIILCAWSLVIAYQTRQHQVFFGVVLTVRPPEIHDIVFTAGCCMNTMPFLVTVQDNISALLTEVRERFGEILEDQTLSTGRLLTALRNDGWAGEMDSLVVFENYPGDRSGTDLGNENRLKVLGSRERNDIPFTLVALSGNACEFELLYPDVPAHHTMAKRLMSQLGRVLKTFINQTKS
ncbi:hypothetical protein TH53_06795 [Pedobacter lusitanus]|uniref:Contig28, whole genome shotgun sequence n=1 Tax=Pedobacter lusitanus TaxID=1503925 RepID=A0A0D0GTZ1_9SPHI|nr:AMP-binding protein [Pedobacter lusitanus]KIO77841.1 hypothetical protein TH53_06795 [Pedobacter lusitanus]